MQVCLLTKIYHSPQINTYSVCFLGHSWRCTKSSTPPPRSYMLLAKVEQGDILPSFTTQIGNKHLLWSMCFASFCFFWLLSLISLSKMAPMCAATKALSSISEHTNEGVCVATEKIGVRNGLFRCELQLLAVSSYTKQGYIMI